MPNNFAYIALILWPFIAILLYKRLPIVNATFWTIVGGFLLLPVKTAIDFPFIPPLDKESIPALAALIGCRYIKKVKIRFLPKEGIEKWLVLVFILTPIITTINNQESYNFIPGLTLHDTFSNIISQYLFILPLIIGMQIIKTYDDQIMLFKLLVIAGLMYSIPILFEIRMSPQLHTWVYGFFPHSFGQQMRFGGFRPVIFMGHGLAVALFVAITLGAAVILLRQKIKIKIIPPWFIVIYFILLLIFSKTVGAFVLGMILFIAITWLSANLANWLSVILISIVILYPFLTILDLFPHERLIEAALSFDTERGESLAFRFSQETILLEHARDKLFFGWGGWGRNRLEATVTDGYWIIILGKYGLFGFVALFGLFFSGVIKSVRMGRINEGFNMAAQQLMQGHILIVSIIMVDQLPNASLSAWLMFISGALFGRAHHLDNRNAI